MDPALPRLGRRPLGGEAAPLEALVGVVGQGEGGDDQPAGHTAELPAEPLHVLADALVPTADNTEAELSPASWGPPLPTLTDSDTPSLDSHQDSRLLSRFTEEKNKTKPSEDPRKSEDRAVFLHGREVLSLISILLYLYRLGVTPGQGLVVTASPGLSHHEEAIFSGPPLGSSA